MNNININKELEMVKKNGYALQDVINQTEEICLAAVKEDGWALQFVKNQTEEICLVAVKQDGCALEYVKDQTEEICLEAVKEDKYVLQYVENQTEEICLAAVKQDIKVLSYIKDKNIFNNIIKELSIYYLEKTDTSRDLIITNDKKCYIGCQDGISIPELIDRIHNNYGGLERNPHRQIYLDFLKEHSLI